jgi:hypothetical protein
MKQEHKPMNEARISEAAKRIAERRLALKWLDQYGAGLTASDAASVTVRLNFASACVGAKEAEAVLSAYGRFSLPAIVNAATECCRNDIAAAVDAIREEVAKAESHT